MMQLIMGFVKKDCLLRWLFLSWLLTFMLASYSIEAQNDLLNLPSVISEKAPESLLLDITKAGNRLVVVGERGHILYSDDNGSSWIQVKSPTSVTLTAVNFPTPDKGWAVGHDGVVLHTSDGGKSWIIQLTGFEENKLNAAHAEMLLSAKELEWESASEEMRTAMSDDLEELQYQFESYDAAVKEGVCCDPLLDVWFINEREGFITGAYGLFFHTKDGGNTWVPCWDRIDNSDRLHLNAIDGSAKDILYIAGESGMLFRSMDGGESWKRLESSFSGSYLGIIASPADDIVLAFGIGAKIVLSEDRGESWKLIETNAGAALSGGTIQENGDVLIVSYSGVILSGSGRTGVLSAKKIGAGWSAVVDTANGHIVLVGLKGIKRVPFAGDNSGG